MFITILELVGLSLVAVAAFMLSPILGLFVLGTILFIIGFVMEGK